MTFDDYSGQRARLLPFYRVRSVSKPVWWGGLMVLPLFISMIAILLMSRNVSAQGQPSFCNGQNCVNLFDASNVDIQSLSVRSPLPIFANPLIEASIQLNSNVPLPVRLYVDEPRWLMNIEPNSGASPTHCQLIIVGIENENPASVNLLYRDLTGGRTHTVPLYAFCERINLPGVRDAGQPFPSRTSTIYTGNPNRFSDLVGLRVDVGRLRDIINRATNGSCTEDTGEPITLRSLATQFAIFTLNSNEPQNIWQQFLLEAGNTYYEANADFHGERENQAILCLLAGANIATPVPTPTPTHTPMPTNPASFVPTPTPTDIPVFERDVLPDNTLGGVRTLNDIFELVALIIVVTILGGVGLLLGRRILQSPRVRFWLIVAIIAFVFFTITVFLLDITGILPFNLFGVSL